MGKSSPTRGCGERNYNVTQKAGRGGHWDYMRPCKGVSCPIGVGLPFGVAGELVLQIWGSVHTGPAGQVARGHLAEKHHRERTASPAPDRTCRGFSEPEPDVSVLSALHTDFLGGCSHGPGADACRLPQIPTHSDLHLHSGALTCVKYGSRHLPLAAVGS